MQVPSLAHPAQPDTFGDGARGQVCPCPHPLAPARDLAGAGRIGLAVSAEYPSVRATRGRGPSRFGPPALGRRPEPIPPKGLEAPRPPR